MTISNFVQFYKDILNEKDYDVLSVCAKKAFDGNSFACALFCSRFDKEKSETVLLSKIKDNDINLISFFFAVSATESVYVRYKNIELLKKCYDFFVNNLSLLKTPTDTLSLTICAFCFDKLRFFASVLNLNQDKANFSKQSSNALAKISCLPFSFAPLFILAYPQEYVEEKVNSSPVSIESSLSSLVNILLSIRGLILYGYEDIADNFKEELYKNIRPVSSLDCTLCAIMCEIALTD